MEDLYETELYAKDGTVLISLSEDEEYQSLFDKYGLLELLIEAKKLGTAPSNSLDVTKKSEGVSMTSDGKYYQTGFVDVVGTVIDAPETYKDVKGAVQNDFQKHLENKWVKQLRKKYKVNVRKKVLKTVNNHN